MVTIEYFLTREDTKILEGLTIASVEGYLNDENEFLVVITTNEGFQMVNAPEGYLTNQYAIVLEKPKQEEV